MSKRMFTEQQVAEWMERNPYVQRPDEALTAMEDAATLRRASAPVSEAMVKPLAALPTATPEPREPMTLRLMQKVNAARSVRWMAGSPGWTTLEVTGELAGEVGELANVCKKLRRSEMGVPGNKVSDEELHRQARGEVADVLIVLMLTASKLGIDLQDAVCETFNAKSEQMGFPERFTSHAGAADEGRAVTEEPESVQIDYGFRRQHDGYVIRVQSPDQLRGQHEPLQRRIITEKWQPAALTRQPSEGA